MPLARMRRLEPLLAPQKSGQPGADEAIERPDARFTASFGYDEEGTVTIDISVDAELPLVCQRSLRPYLEPVHRRSLLGVIRQAAEEETLASHYDPVLAEDGRLALLDLVEDELLLALPQVPRNPEVGEVRQSTDGRAEARPAADEERTHRPFEGLAGLMKKGADS